MLRTFLLLLLTGVCGGCIKGTVWREHRALPSAVLSSQLDEAYSDSSFVPGDFPTENWWEMMSDPQLNEWIAQALSYNPSMALAVARVKQALAYTCEERSALFPHVDWTGEFDQYKLASDELSPEGEQGPLSYIQLQSYLEFYWSPDLWGKYRSAWLAAKGEAYALQAELSVTRLLLSLAVAQNYYALQIALQRQSLAESVVENRTRLVAFQEQLFQHSLADAYAVDEARVSLALAEDFILQIQQDVVMYSHALQALVAGDFEKRVCPIETVDVATMAVPLPTTLPCDLLGRRPEIVGQIWRIYSARKYVRVAQTDFYPNVDLYALFGLNTIHLTEFFRGRSFSDQIGAAVSLPVFDAGRRWGRLRATEEEYMIRVEEYNQLVLDAVREALDGVQLLTLSRKRWGAMEQQRVLREREYALTEQRFQANIDSAIALLLSQELYFSSRDQELVSQEGALLALLQLVRALGGGFNPCGEIA